VNPERELLWDPMDVALFEKCIRKISREYNVVILEDHYSSGKIQTGKKLATIMFDDGYQDNIRYALPILDKYQCKASFYVVTDCIDQNKPTWTYILDYLFKHTAVSGLDLDFGFLPDTLKIKSLNSSRDRLKFVANLKPALKKLPHVQRNQVLEYISGVFGDVELPKIMMSWSDLNELKNQGHYIGSHTVRHSMLGTLEDENEIKFELLESGKRIEEMLGYFPLTVSYPVGSFNETTKRLAKESGYKLGLAVKQEIFDDQHDDLFEIPRIQLFNEPWWKTTLRMSNTLEIIKKRIGYK